MAAHILRRVPIRWIHMPASAHRAKIPVRADRMPYEGKVQACLFSDSPDLPNPAGASRDRTCYPLIRVLLVEREPCPVRRNRIGRYAALALSELLRFSRTIRPNPLERPVAGALGLKNNMLAI